jgi:hypothetical protein
LTDAEPPKSWQFEPALAKKDQWKALELAQELGFGAAGPTAEIPAKDALSVGDTFQPTEELLKQLPAGSIAESNSGSKFVSHGNGTVSYEVDEGVEGDIWEAEDFAGHVTLTVKTLEKEVVGPTEGVFQLALKAFLTDPKSGEAVKWSIKYPVLGDDLKTVTKVVTTKPKQLYKWAHTGKYAPEGVQLLGGFPSTWDETTHAIEFVQKKGDWHLVITPKMGGPSWEFHPKGALDNINTLAFAFNAAAAPETVPVPPAPAPPSDPVSVFKPGGNVDLGDLISAKPGQLFTVHGVDSKSSFTYKKGDNGLWSEVDGHSSDVAPDVFNALINADTFLVTWGTPEDAGYDVDEGVSLTPGQKITDKQQLLGAPIGTSVAIKVGGIEVIYQKDDVDLWHGFGPDGEKASTDLVANDFAGAIAAGTLFAHSPGIAAETPKELNGVKLGDKIGPLQSDGMEWSKGAPMGTVLLSTSGAQYTKTGYDQWTGDNWTGPGGFLAWDKMSLSEIGLGEVPEKMEALLEPPDEGKGLEPGDKIPSHEWMDNAPEGTQIKYSSPAAKPLTKQGGKWAGGIFSLESHEINPSAMIFVAAAVPEPAVTSSWKIGDIVTEDNFDSMPEGTVFEYLNVEFKVGPTGDNGTGIYSQMSGLEKTKDFVSNLKDHTAELKPSIVEVGAGPGKDEKPADEIAPGDKIPDLEWLNNAPVGTEVVYAGKPGTLTAGIKQHTYKKTTGGDWSFAGQILSVDNFGPSIGDGNLYFAEYPSDEPAAGKLQFEVHVTDSPKKHNIHVSAGVVDPESDADHALMLSGNTYANLSAIHKQKPSKGLGGQHEWKWEKDQKKWVFYYSDQEEAKEAILALKGDLEHPDHMSASTELIEKIDGAVAKDTFADSVGETIEAIPQDANVPNTQLQAVQETLKAHDGKWTIQIQKAGVGGISVGDKVPHSKWLNMAPIGTAIDTEEGVFVKAGSMTWTHGTFQASPSYLINNYGEGIGGKPVTLAANEMINKEAGKVDKSVASMKSWATAGKYKPKVLKGVADIPEPSAWHSENVEVDEGVIVYTTNAGQQITFTPVGTKAKKESIAQQLNAFLPIESGLTWKGPEPIQKKIKIDPPKLATIVAKPPTKPHPGKLLDVSLSEAYEKSGFKVVDASGTQVDQKKKNPETGVWEASGEKKTVDVMDVVVTPNNHLMEAELLLLSAGINTKHPDFKPIKHVTTEINGMMQSAVALTVDKSKFDAGKAALYEDAHISDDNFETMPESVKSFIIENTESYRGVVTITAHASNETHGVEAGDQLHCVITTDGVGIFRDDGEKLAGYPLPKGKFEGGYSAKPQLLRFVYKEYVGFGGLDGTPWENHIEVRHVGRMVVPKEIPSVISDLSENVAKTTQYKLDKGEIEFWEANGAGKVMSFALSEEPWEAFTVADELGSPSYLYDNGGNVLASNVSEVLSYLGKVEIAELEKSAITTEAKVYEAPAIQASGEFTTKGYLASTLSHAEMINRANMPISKAYRKHMMGLAFGAPGQPDGFGRVVRHVRGGKTEHVVNMKLGAATHSWLIQAAKDKGFPQETIQSKKWLQFSWNDSKGACEPCSQYNHPFDGGDQKLIHRKCFNVPVNVDGQEVMVTIWNHAKDTEVSIRFPADMPLSIREGVGKALQGLAGGQPGGPQAEAFDVCSPDVDAEIARKKALVTRFMPYAIDDTISVRDIQLGVKATGETKSSWHYKADSNGNQWSYSKTDTDSDLQPKPAKARYTVEDLNKAFDALPELEKGMSTETKVTESGVVVFVSGGESKEAQDKIESEFFIKTGAGKVDDVPTAVQRAISVYKNGLFGSRKRTGIIGNSASPGTSPNEDIHAGCDVVFCRPQNGSVAGQYGGNTSCYGGSFTCVIDPSVMRSANIRMTDGDSFGQYQASSSCNSATSLKLGRDFAQGKHSTHAEILPTHVDSSNITSISVPDHLLSGLISGLKKQGINDWHGVPLEEFFIKGNGTQSAAMALQKKAHKKNRKTMVIKNV